MKDTLSYSVTVDGEENLGSATRALKEWIEGLPDRARVRIRLGASVKDAEDAAAMSKTSDMFKKGEVKDGVQRKGRGRGKAKLSAVPQGAVATETGGAAADPDAQSPAAE